jgi:hypothetical protein
MFCSIYLLLSIEYLNTNFCTSVCMLWSWVPCCMCSEFSFLLWAWLKIVDGKLWLSFEYKSCGLFNLDVFRIFVWYHCYCEIKVMKMRSNITTAVCWRGLFLPVVRWERRIVMLVDCFMCMVVLVLRIVYGQVVLLRTVLNFVAWQLEKTSKCSAVVYTLSLVIRKHSSKLM